MGVHWLCKLVGLASLAPGTLNAAEFHHRVYNDGSAIILIAGEITAGDDSKFRELSVRFPDAMVGLDSSGGAIVPALEIGRQIRLRGYSTVVTSSSVCTSACALIWLAGTPRYLDQGGGVGFHATYKDQGGKLVETGVGNALVGHYLSQLSLSERAVVFATSASPYEISWLNYGNRISSGIEFSVPDPEPQSPRSSPKTTQSGARAPALPSPPPPIYTPPASIPAPVRASTQFTAASLRAQFSRPHFAEVMASKSGLVGTQRAIFAEHLRATYANDKYLARIATEMNTAGSALSGKNAEIVAFELAAGLAQKLIYAGFRRLSDDDIHKFITVMATISIDASVQECGAIFFGTDNQTPTLEFQVVGRQGDDTLREYLALMRKAIFAEIDRSPSVVQLSSTQAEAGEAAATDEMLRIIGTLPAADQAAVSEAMADMDTAKLPNKCAAMTVVLAAASTMEGIVGDWYRRRFIEMSQE